MSTYETNPADYLRETLARLGVDPETNPTAAAFIERHERLHAMLKDTVAKQGAMPNPRMSAAEFEAMLREIGKEYLSDDVATEVARFQAIQAGMGGKSAIMETLAAEKGWPIIRVGNDPEDGIPPESPLALWLAGRDDPKLCVPATGIEWEHVVTHEDKEGNPFPHAQTISMRGTVRCRHPRIWPRKETVYTFDALTPFAQGYVEALLSDTAYFHPHAKSVRFDQIHPPTLLRIIRDCERADPHAFDPESAAYKGMCFWVDRLNGELSPGYRPLEPMLSKGRIIFGLVLGACVAKAGVPKGWLKP